MIFQQRVIDESFLDFILKVGPNIFRKELFVPQVNKQI